MIRPALVLACVLLSAPVAAKTACPMHFAGGQEPRLVNPKLGIKTRVLCFRAYGVLHSGVTRTPLWSAEHLTAQSVGQAEALEGRDNKFHAERRLPRSERAELSDYLRSSFDRGHMAPSGDMPTREADHESFSLANIVPQARKLNQGNWSKLEGLVRDLTTASGEAYVVTGPLFEGATIKALKQRVLVPTATWKAIYIPSQGTAAWIATNSDRPAWQLVSIDVLTKRSGIDAFPGLPAAIKAKAMALPLPRERRGR